MKYKESKPHIHQESASTTGKDLGVEKQVAIKFDDLNFVEEFNPGIKSSHPKYRYEDPETGRLFIVKRGPSHTIRADFVSGNIFSLLGLEAVAASIDEDPNTDNLLLISPDLSASYEPLSLDTGSRFRKKELKLGDFLKNPEHQEAFKDSILATLLTGDYDRVPWNVITAKDGSSFLQIDFGASLGARARGGYNGFLPHIDETEMNIVLRDPYDILPNANELHADVIEVTADGPKIKDRERLKRLADHMKEFLTDDAIDSIIERAKWPDNSIEENRNENVNLVDKILRDLNYSLLREAPNSLGYIKTERAIKTYQLIRDEYDSDFSSYFSFALKSRRDDLIKLFGSD